MATYMVVASFDPITDLPQMNTVLEAEIARVKELRETQRVGAIHIAATQGRVFIEVFAQDPSSAEDIVKSLPMAAWWNLEVYTTAGPKTSV